MDVVDGVQWRAATPRCGAGRSSEGGGSSGASKNDREKGVNVQVLLRCRPLNDNEVRLNTPVVISCNEHLREVSAVLSAANKQVDKTFTFDKVFGPSSQQKDLYEKAIAPLVLEVLEGYNCTIFAYGQTGTGKTFTMEGSGRRSKVGDLPADAGVIPRAVKQIFETLERQNMDYSMKVTFLELYNEDITDLLAPDEPKFQDERCKKPLVLMEDGKGGVLVRGLEEEIVCSASEIYKVLEKGTSRRRTAETLVNKRSSRSHSIFSVVIHIKECTHDGEEMIKSGKLNLVDLAGSENILRSGARDGRAREAGEINKSLLTLGRVITSLVEHSCHVPYRESKLTRLLRDSLGGRTKTCIIATVSPTIHCLEETLSTLDYAHRAKNIRNKPEVNQKVMKSELIKDLYAEIDRLKQEVSAAREKNGVYIPRERYLSDEAGKKAMLDKLERLELCVGIKDTQLNGLNELYHAEKLESAKATELLKNTQGELDDTKHAFQELEKRYFQANSSLAEKEQLICNLLKSEEALLNCAHELRSELENAAADLSGLFSKIERKAKVEDKNKTLVQDFHQLLIQQLNLLQGEVSVSAAQHESQIRGMEEDMLSLAFMRAKATEEIHGRAAELKNLHSSQVRWVSDVANEFNAGSQFTLRDLSTRMSSYASAFDERLKSLLDEADGLFDKLQKTLSEQEGKLVAFAELQKQGHNRALDAVRSVLKLTSGFFENLEAWTSNLTEIVEGAQAAHDRELHEFEKKIEDRDIEDERLLIEAVTKMLTLSSARKKSMVREGVDVLREAAAKRTNAVHEERLAICRLVASVKDHWTSYMQGAENRFHEDIAGVEHGISALEKQNLQCIRFANLGSMQWRDAEGAMRTLLKENSETLDSLQRSGTERGQQLKVRLDSTSSEALLSFSAACKDLLSSIECSCKLQDDKHQTLVARMDACHARLIETEDLHLRKVAGIKEDALRKLEGEYEVEEPTTPVSRRVSSWCAASIDGLRTPPSCGEALKQRHNF